MSVNGIHTSSQVAAAYTSVAASAKSKTTETAEKKASETATSKQPAAVYEPSASAATADADAKSSTSKIYKSNTELVDFLKKDAEARIQNMQSMVEKLMCQQATTNGNATDIWSFLREGNFTVDPETKKAAQDAISEDGYWGVKQTSDRIVQFATALTGGDPDKLDSMIEAFKKGFKQAEKTWGGELPDISKKTYDAVLEKFDALKNADVEA